MQQQIQNRKLSRVIPTRTKAPLQLVSLSNGTLDGHETMVIGEQIQSEEVLLEFT